jgi:hypothetical protein
MVGGVITPALRVFYGNTAKERKRKRRFISDIT